MLCSKPAVLIDLSNEQGHAFCLLTQGHFALTVLRCVLWSFIKGQLTMKVHLGRGEKVDAVTNGFI